MPTLSPAVKKILSAVAVAAASGAIMALNGYVVQLPPAVQGIAGSLLIGLAHWLNAAGTEQQVAQKLVARSTL